MNWTEYEEFKAKMRQAEEQAKRLKDEAKNQERARKQAAIDPMTELAKLATSTHAVNETVNFDNGWGCYISRKEGESRFSFTQSRSGYNGIGYTQLTPVQVVREMYKVSQYA